MNDGDVPVQDRDQLPPPFPLHTARSGALLCQNNTRVSWIYLFSSGSVAGINITGLNNRTPTDIAALKHWQRPATMRHTKKWRHTTTLSRLSLI